ncbi:hypothetical protein Micbo1qcDRAFT_237246 [Microdochium bolleyi]|uniref:ATP phosphoribosyltransferase n=1 Tax=Microdochium bolleyi TaxID=196109 RepID=A0A136ILL4_9PEZI|nr:hypothetical protein Micbo1qcDRAFT_237246 [Microdochium bolleyi]
MSHNPFMQPSGSSSGPLGPGPAPDPRGKGQSTSAPPPPPPPGYSPPTVYRLVFFAPKEHVKKCEDAIFAVGAGRSLNGEYAEAVACYKDGFQKYRPRGMAPTFARRQDVGYRVETTCVGKDVARKAVEALVAVLPHPEMSYQLFKVESLDSLLE